MYIPSVERGLLLCFFFLVFLTLPLLLSSCLSSSVIMSNSLHACAKNKVHYNIIPSEESRYLLYSFSISTLLLLVSPSSLSSSSEVRNTLYVSVLVKYSICIGGEFTSFNNAALPTFCGEQSLLFHHLVNFL